MHSYLEQHRFLKGVTLFARRYFDHRVSRDSAALTYYLLFSIFPLLVFLSNLVGILAFDIDAVLRELAAVMPREVIELIRQYYEYASAESSTTLLGFSLVFSIYFPYRAANALMLSVRKAYGMSEQPAHFLKYQGKVLLYTVCLILSIPVMILLSTVGGRVLNFAAGYIYVSDAFILLWGKLRFVLLGVVIFAAVALLYGLAQEKRPLRRIWPGVLAALIMWMLLSMLFSLYVETAARYSVIYGSIGTIVVLLLWLYLAATMLIMGAEFNSVLLEVQGERHHQEDRSI